MELNTKTKGKDKTSKYFQRTPSYCKDEVKMVKHISENLARIFIVTHKNKIETILKEVSMGK